MSILKASFILFYCSVYAGQVPVVQTVNPAATSLYQLCIHELAQKPGADYSAMPPAIQADLRPLQQDRFVEDSIIYEELRGRALQEESRMVVSYYTAITKEAIAYAYKHFPDSDVSCATEIARGYVSLPHEALFWGCTMPDICFCGLFAAIGGAACFSSALHYALLMKLTYTFYAFEGCAVCGRVSILSSLCLRKQCLDAALPHYNPPRTMRMDLNIPGGSFVQQEQFPVDEDTSGEDILYNDGAPLL